MKLNIQNKLKFVIPGILFYIVLNIFFKSFGFSVSAVVLLFLLSAASAFWITRYRYLPIILSILFAMGSVTFLLSIGESSLQQYFIIFVSLLFVVTMVGLYRFFMPQEERPREEKIQLIDSGFSLNQAIVIFSLFFLSSGIYGIYIIAGISTWQMMLVMLVGIYLSSYYLIKINFIKSQELELHLDYYRNRTFNFYSFLLALVMIELVWGLIYLPINHLTFGATVLVVFFSYWNIAKSYLRNELTRRKFIVSVAFAALAVVAIFSTSKLYIN